MSRKKTREIVHQVLLNYVQASELLGISDNHLWRLNSAGKIPSPIHMGRSTRWRKQELEDWIKAGAPDREQWERMREQVK
jgi:excisionase family DNA binding protein